MECQDKGKTVCPLSKFLHKFYKYENDVTVKIFEKLFPKTFLITRNQKHTYYRVYTKGVYLRFFLFVCIKYTNFLSLNNASFSKLGK